MKRKKKINHIIKKKAIKIKRKGPRKTWLIKPVTRVKPSGKTYNRRGLKKEIEVYDDKDAQNSIT